MASEKLWPLLCIIVAYIIHSTSKCRIISNKLKVFWSSNLICKKMRLLMGKIQDKLLLQASLKISPSLSRDNIIVCRFIGVIEDVCSIPSAVTCSNMLDFPVVHLLV